MITFLTSSFVEFQERSEYEPKPIVDSNCFTDNLKRFWMNGVHFLIFSSDPADYAMGDHLKKEMWDAFSLSGFDIEEMRVFDDRAIGDSPEASLREALRWADVLLLAGGHAPTQNAFLKKCKMKKILRDKSVFDGIIIGISAGSINAASEAYLIPELEGESLNPNFVRFTDGLGLSNLNIVPHLEYMSTRDLDGQKIIDEIIAEDSQGKDIYLIDDGSYFIIKDGMTEFFGSGYVMRDGEIRPLVDGIVLQNSVLEAISSKRYRFIFEVKIRTGQCKFLFVSKNMLDNGFIPVHIETYQQFCKMLVDKLVVEEEKIPVYYEFTLDSVIEGIKQEAEFERTFHINSSYGINAYNIRAVYNQGCYERLVFEIIDNSEALDHDWMTDELSRTGFIARAESFLQNRQDNCEYSVVYTNIKGFKAINELLGSNKGDLVIFKERDYIEEIFKPRILARLEDDHFAFLVKTSEITEDKIKKLEKQCFEDGDKSMPFFITAGIYNIVDYSDMVQTMLDKAKLAENSISTEHGYSYAVWTEEMSNKYRDQRALILELDKGLELGEFMTYYQPIVDAKTTEIVSAEALIRWNHYEKGMISPAQFIPVFEREGLISKLDNFMINSVIDFNMNRIEQGKKIVPCAVNLSRVDFYDVRLLEVLKEKIGKQHNVKDMLKLEVTESAYAVLESVAIDFLMEMKKLGLTLLLDDFGSGMSSFSTLETFEFDVLKLDVGFIRRIGKSKKAEAIIEHIIALSHALGIKVVAEGVETEEQLMFLRSVNCDMIQGYYFYKPMTSQEFEKCLSK